jgi:hypothetical protein
MTQTTDATTGNGTNPQVNVSDEPVVDPAANTPELDPATEAKTQALTRDAASTRERILNVALDLFSDKGYDGTSLREIA